MNIDVDVQYAANAEDGEPPSPATIQAWVVAALAGRRDQAELTVRIVGIDEMRELNSTYRHQDKPTNVLSFPFEAPPGVELPLLGDVLVCAAVVAQEAQQQGKQLYDHWAHMVVHGVLHLLGYDHETDAEADEMESLERGILQQIGIADPYSEN